MKPKIHR